MTALAAGQSAPNFSLADARGQTHTLAEASRIGPNLLVFFKITCPTCRLAFPYLEKLNQAYGDCVPFIGVAQDSAAEATTFSRENGGASFLLLADPPDYAVSSRYGLTNVPTVFAIEKGGKIAFTSIGFSKKDLRELAQILADWSDRLVVDLFPKGDPAPDMKPG